MAKSRRLNVNFPLGGLDRGASYRQQRPFTTPDCLNVRPFASIEGRERGGSRPGMVQSHVNDFGSEIQFLYPMTLALGDGFNVFSDAFSGLSMADAWTQASWAEDMPSILPSAASASIDTTVDSGAAVLDALPIDTGESYCVEALLVPWNKAWHGTYTLYLRLDDTTPDIETDGVAIELTMTGSTGAYSASMTSLVSEVETEIDTDTGTIAPGPGWLTAVVTGTTVTVYWQNTQILTGTVGTHSGSRVGFGLACSTVGGVCLCNVFRVQYYSTLSNESNRTLLVASAGGNLYKETFHGQFEQITTNLSLRDDIPLQCCQSGQKLYIADYGEVFSGTSGNVTGPDPESGTDEMAHGEDGVITGLSGDKVLVAYSTVGVGNDDSICIAYHSGLESYATTINNHIGELVAVIVNKTGYIPSGVYPVMECKKIGTNWGVALRGNTSSFSGLIDITRVTGTASISIEYRPSLVSESVGDWTEAGVDDLSASVGLSGGSEGIESGLYEIECVYGNYLLLKDTEVPSGTCDFSVGFGIVINGIGQLVLTDENVEDWNAIGINKEDYVVVIYNGVGAVTDGTYEIESISSSAISLKKSAGTGSCAYRIERAPKIYDPSDDSVSLMVATTGQVPTGCPLISRFCNRVVLAGAEVAPHVWYASRAGDELDWDYSQEDTERAVAGTNSAAGTPGQPITALAPHSDDYLIMSGISEVWRMRGDPAYESSLDALSRKVGIVDANAWTLGPNGEVVFLSQLGFYAIGPGGDTYPVELSRKQLPSEFKNIDFTSSIISLEYDSKDNGIHVFVTQDHPNDRLHWWIDWSGKTFWPLSIDGDYEPTATCCVDSAIPEEGGIILGCRDGKLRKFNGFADNDCGTEFDSYVVIGPIAMNDDGSIGVLGEVEATLAAQSGAVSCEVITALTFEEATTAEACSTLSWSAGLNYVDHPAGTGQAMSLKLSGEGETWALENIVVTVFKSGPRRRW